MAARVIKRYKNRRLYDSEEKKTIKLEDLAELVKQDVDFKVVDSGTERDVTISVLTKVLSESIEDKKNLKQTSPPQADLSMAEKLIRLLIARGGEITMDFFKKSVLFGLGVFDLTKEKAEKLVDEMIKRGEMSQSDKAKAVQELLKGHDERMKKLNAKIDETVEKITARVRGKEQEELTKLHQKLDALTKVVEKLEKKLSEK